MMESYIGVGGGTSLSVAGAGSLSPSARVILRRRGSSTHHVPPTSSRSSNASIVHRPALYSTDSLRIFMTARPAAPAPSTHMSRPGRESIRRSVAVCCLLTALGLIDHDG